MHTIWREYDHFAMEIAICATIDARAVKERETLQMAFYWSRHDADCD